MPSFSNCRTIGRGRVALTVSLASCLLAGGLPARLSAAEAVPAARAADEAAIRAASRDYVAALDKGDKATLAKLWAPDGDIIDAAGHLLTGREALALDGDVPPPDPANRPEVKLTETQLRFITADVAIEDGAVEVIPPTGPPLTGRFSATWVRHEGAWKLAALRESRGDEPTAAAALADLDWMVGDWAVVEDPGQAAAAGKARIEVAARWNAARTYLIRTMTISHTADAPPLEIVQRIGWDPLTKSIRSWVFGSDGSHGEADWTRDGSSWVAQARAILPDGSQATSLNIYTYDGQDHCVWRSLPTHVGGEHVPAVNMTMIRKPRAAGDQPQGNP
jgi:uncharacterized protein (TIGR02246 family)